MPESPTLTQRIEAADVLLDFVPTDPDPAKYAPTLHPDYSVTYWSVYQQQWVRSTQVPDRELAAQTLRDREAIKHHLASRPRRESWSTYRESSYSHDVSGGDNPKSAGGVHYHQVRKTASGWRRRIVQVNGFHRAVGPVEAIDAAEGEALFARAEKY